MFMASWRIQRDLKVISGQMTFFFLVYITSQIRTLVRAWRASLWLNPLLESAVIPFECWFVSVLLCFPSNSLLVAWQSSRGWLKVFGPCTLVRDLKEAPGFGLVQLLASKWLSFSCCGYLETECRDRRYFSLLLFLYLAVFPIK